jgi:hypothetical protein
MNAGVRILIAFGALALFLGLRLLALFKSDHALLGWLFGGAPPEPELVPIPVQAQKPRRRG